MTLCAAWIRTGQGDEGEELVFATDSRLRGYGTWDSGMKLFSIGRPDCLICFAGDTLRAYPLILQGSNLQRYSIAWSNPRLDISDVLESLCNLFTEIGKKIDPTELSPTAEPPLTGHDKADFLFGGWSWRAKEFHIWRISYNSSLKAYAAEKIESQNPAMRFVFLGDEMPMGAANQLLTDEMSGPKSLRGYFDMEPLRVLEKIALEKKYDTVGGSLQVAKVYRSGLHEFFGVKTLSGQFAVLGREINRYDAPPMRYIDLQTDAYLETLPPEFSDIDKFDFGIDTQFVCDCYPQGKLKADLTEVNRYRLQRIFNDTAYTHFVSERETFRVSIIEEVSPEESAGQVGAELAEVAEGGDETNE